MKKLKIIIIVVVIILLTPFWLMLFYICKVEIQHNLYAAKSEKTRNENKEKNFTALEKYLKDKYGLLLYEEFNIEEDKKNFGPNGIYDISCPFLEKRFGVCIVSEAYGKYQAHEIYQDTFYETIAIDPKFQHLYSEWVKKQVGIEDENVELGFTGNFDKPYIDFDKITSLSDDYREVFENTHNLRILEIKKQNIKDLSKTSWFNYANSFIDKYDNLKRICGLNPVYDDKGVLLHLYRYDYNNSNKYYGTYENPNNMEILIQEGKIYNGYAGFKLLDNGIEKKYIINRNGEEID